MAGALAGTLVVSGWVMARTGRPEPEPGTGPVLVTATATRRDFRLVVTVKARVAGRVPVPVRVTGSSITWRVPSGSTVRRGQHLATARRSADMDSLRTELAAALREAAAQDRVEVLDLGDADRAVEAARRQAAQEEGGGALADALADARSARQRLLITQRQSRAERQEAIASLRSRLAKARSRLEVEAPAAGRLIREGRRAWVLPQEYTVRAPLDPALAYKVLLLAESRIPGASVTLPAGPPPFACDSTGVVSSDAESTGERADPAVDESSESVEPSADTHVVCRPPAGTPLVAGLEGTMALTLWRREAVVVVDAAAVSEYDLVKGTGVVDVVGAGEAPVRRRISVGPGDGLSVVVHDGLQPGERVVLPSGAAGPP